MKSFALIAFVALATISMTSAVRIRNCGGKGKVDYSNIKITGCSRNSPSCIFERNTTAQLSLPFVASTEITSLKAVVHGVIAGIPIPFPIDNPEACDNSVTCPVQSGTAVTYLEGLPVKTIYPALKLTVKWALVDQNDVSQVCILIPVKIQ